MIEIYETVLRRGRMLSIEAGINYGPANDALLLAAGYLNDLYMFVGNEARADAAMLDREVDLILVNGDPEDFAHRPTVGDRIAVVARNSEMHATTVMAAAKIGAIAVVVNWRLAAPEVEHIFQDSGPLALPAGRERRIS